MIQSGRKTIIYAPADAIWQVIGDFGAACQHLARVVNCTIEGEGVGAPRTVTLANGSAIVQRLAALDEAAQRLSDALLTDTPCRHCLTTVTVRVLAATHTLVIPNKCFVLTARVVLDE